jgi:membrane protein YdbS with pleckstrin-like domain
MEDATARTDDDRLPTRSGAELERLEGRVIPFWMVSGLVSLLVLAALVGLVLLVFGDRLPGGSTLPILAAVVLGSILLWTIVAPTLAWRRWRFRIDDELLMARYGIVFHEEKAIPISRMQHVDLTRGPIERAFGLATLIVYTAGTEGAIFRVPGLSVERARDLRDRILAARGDDVV